MAILLRDESYQRNIGIAARDTILDRLMLAHQAENLARIYREVRTQNGTAPHRAPSGSTVVCSGLSSAPQAPSPAPDLIPAETKNQPRTQHWDWYSKRGTSWTDHRFASSRCEKRCSCSKGHWRRWNSPNLPLLRMEPHMGSRMFSRR
jgi:hypothetical protein